MIYRVTYWVPCWMDDDSVDYVQYFRTKREALREVNRLKAWKRKYERLEAKLEAMPKYDDRTDLQDERYTELSDEIEQLREPNSINLECCEVPKSKAEVIALLRMWGS